MKLNSSIVFFALAALISSNAFAADSTMLDGAPAVATTHANGPSWEFSGSTNAGFFHSFGSDGNSDSNAISLSGAENYFVIPQMELGLIEAFADNITPGPNSYVVSLLAGPIFNFGDEDPARSFFIEARVGIEIGNNGYITSTSFAYLGGIGHRFELVKHVNWKPEADFVGCTSSGVISTTKQLQIVPFQFSILF